MSGKNLILYYQSRKNSASKSKAFTEFNEFQNCIVDDVQIYETTLEVITVAVLRDFNSKSPKEYTIINNLTNESLEQYNNKVYIIIDSEYDFAYGAGNINTTYYSENTNNKNKLEALQTLFVNTDNRTLHLIIKSDNLKRVSYNSSGNNIQRLKTIDLSGCTNLKSIGLEAFDGCTNLESVNLSYCTNLENIGQSVFKNCEKLEWVDLTGCTNLISIGGNAFHNCPALYYVGKIMSELDKTKNNITNGLINLNNFTKLTTIESNAFEKCAELNRINISGCESLRTIDTNKLIKYGNDIYINEIPDNIKSLKSLKSLDYSNFTFIKSIDLDFLNDITDLESINFSGCINLRQIISNNNTLIKIIDFSNCTNLIINENTFGNLTNLESINLSNCINLTTIDQNTFGNLANLVSIDFSNCTNLTTIDENTFVNLTNLESINFSNCTNLTTINQNTFKNLNNLKSINFSNCTGLSSIDMFCFTYLPKLETIDFSGCYNLKEMKAEPIYDANGDKEISQTLYYKMINFNSCFTAYGNRDQIIGISAQNNRDFFNNVDKNSSTNKISVIDLSTFSYDALLGLSGFDMGNVRKLISDYKDTFELNRIINKSDTNYFYIEKLDTNANIDDIITNMIEEKHPNVNIIIYQQISGSADVKYAVSWANDESKRDIKDYLRVKNVTYSATDDYETTLELDSGIQTSNIFSIITNNTTTFFQYGSITPNEEATAEAEEKAAEAVKAAEDKAVEAVKAAEEKAAEDKAVEAVKAAEEKAAKEKAEAVAAAEEKAAKEKVFAKLKAAINAARKRKEIVKLEVEKTAVKEAAIRNAKMLIERFENDVNCITTNKKLFEKIRELDFVKNNIDQCNELPEYLPERVRYPVAKYKLDSELNTDSDIAKILEITNKISDANNEIHENFNSSNEQLFNIMRILIEKLTRLSYLFNIFGYYTYWIKHN